ncbi:hypothetical protein C4D60_Mb06t19990 [Musa balbisiana]|uniref:NB-ARC domain-containing protein n=1 Tax=Musa balbisiana TaxID=52838 RepID=A0A4S8IPA6_MUSBA|nr:hypothetical protein C4D60_Mb06t19990 [Musa balbisiana]
MAELIIAGWFVSSVVTKVTDIIKFYMKNQIEYRKDKKWKLHELEKHLRKIQAAIFEVGKRRITNPSLEAWLWDVKDAVYSVEDIIDDFHYKLEEKARSKGEGKVSRVSLLAQKVGAETKEFLKAFAFASETTSKLNTAVQTSAKLVEEISILVSVAQFSVVTNKQHGVAIPDWRRTTSPTKSTCRARGRQHDIDRLLNMIGDASGDDKYSVVAIVGHGGVGKTHLARLVYNIVKEEKRFDIMVWVCACNNFDVRRLSIEMVESAAIKRPSDLHTISNLEEIQNILGEGLMGKRFLIVLDDVWEESNTNWENLCVPLNYGEKGSKIVVTTTNQNVAKMMRTKEIIHLDGVEGEECWELVREHALGDRNHIAIPHKLESIGKKIAMKLGGSPLAAVTVGRALESKLEEEHWRRILRKRICEVKQTEGDIVAVLRLSYEDLPAHLKQCYLSCSLFPRNHCFEKDELVRFWMALGFVRGDDENTIMEDIGEELIEELSGRSFFVNAKRRHDKFELHPILHEFAECVCDGEYFRFEGIKSSKPIRIPNKAHHVYVAADDLIAVTETLCEKKEIRSLVVAGRLSSTHKDIKTKYNLSLEMVLKSLESLRLLVVSELVSGLPEAIGELKHLRYLEVPGNAITEWPKSFCKLYHLQWLILRMHSKSVSLPDDMNKLSNLRCVDADSEAIAGLPWIGNLIYLQELREYRIQRKKKGFDVGQLKHMNQLRRLCIRGLQHVESREQAAEAVLEDKEHLRWLELCWSNEGKPIAPTACKDALEGLRPHPDLRELKINGYKGERAPRWMESKYLLGLEKLEMWSCHQLTSLPPLGELPFLRVLHLRRMDSVEEVGAEFYGSTDAPFPSLEELWFDKLNQWKKWDVEAKQRREVFPRLRKLAIGNCRSLTGLITLPSSLDDLVVRFFAGGDSWDLPEDEASTSTLMLHVDNLSLLQRCLQEGHLTSLRRLEIRGSFDLEAFARGLVERLDHISSLHHLHLTGVYRPQHLPRQLVTLPSLKSLHIVDCPEINMLPEGRLPSNLVDLQINGCPKLEQRYEWTTGPQGCKIHAKKVNEVMQSRTPEKNEKVYTTR